MASRKPVIGVMGAAGGASPADLALAEELGAEIARRNWVLLTGGRDSGVMKAATRGAKAVAGSLTVGILPSSRGEESPLLDVAIFTDMGNARNAINVLSSDVVVVCGNGGAGTASEAALAIKVKKPLILLRCSKVMKAFFTDLSKDVRSADTVSEAASMIEGFLQPRQT